MQKLRPYVLSGLFVFHLMTVCVLLTTVSGKDKPSAIAVIVTLLSQFFLTALFAGLGPGSWALRIPSWGALAALSWISLVFLAMRSGAPTPNGNGAWGLPLLFLIAWIVLMTLLLCLRGIPFLKWRFALQPTLAARQSNQPHQDSLTRGIMVVVATWGGVLVLLKDSWPWPELVTESSKLSDDLLEVVGIAALVAAGALVVAVLAVGLTLTRLADWMFYRRRWTLPLLVTLTMGAAIGLLLGFGGPFRSGSERLLATLGLLLGLATQPLTTLLVMGMAGYRLAPRRQPKRCDSESAAQTAQTITEAPAGNWLARLHCIHIAALAAVVVFSAWIVTTGLWRDHFIRTFLGKLTRNDTGEITRLELNSSVTDAGLVHLRELTNLQRLHIGVGTQITDAGLVHLKGMTNLQKLYLPSQITDAGVAELRKALPNCKLESPTLNISK